MKINWPWCDVEPEPEPPKVRTEAEEWERCYAMYLRVFVGMKQGIAYTTGKSTSEEMREIGVTGPCVAEAILAITLMDVKNNRPARAFASFQTALKDMLSPPKELST